MNDDAERFRRHAHLRRGHTAPEAGSVAKLAVVVCGLAGAAAAVGFLIERNAVSELRAEIAGLQRENRALVALHRENTVMLGELVEAAQLRRDDGAFRELAEQGALLHAELQSLARTEGVRAAAPQIWRVQVYDSAAVDRAPVPRFQARPRYPIELQRAGIGGEVLVDFTVDTDGNVQHARAARSSNPVLAQYAVEAVTRWKFTPGQKQGENVPTRLQARVVFDPAAERQLEPEQRPDAGAVRPGENTFRERGGGGP